MGRYWSAAFHQELQALTLLPLMEGLGWDYARYQTFLGEVQQELNQCGRLQMVTKLCACLPLQVLFPLTWRQSCFPRPESIQLDGYMCFVHTGEIRKNDEPLRLRKPLASPEYWFWWIGL